jgi:GNAT superfamily N-acetyltransferase
VQYVCTEAAWRGRGLGRAVMDALVGWCRVNDVLLVELHASPDGLPLYRSMGFDDNPNPALRLRLSAAPPPNSA